jgi:hypothetical protein
LPFDYGQKHRVELERAQSLVDYINDQISQNLNIHIKDIIPEDKQPGLDLEKIHDEWIKTIEQRHHIIQLN